MKPLICFTVCSLFIVVSTAKASDQNNNTSGVYFKSAHEIIDKKCTVCHSKDKINIAINSGRDMDKILKSMENRGVHLSSNENEVLGIFWKQSKPVTKK